MKQFLAFVVTTLIWAGAARLLLDAELVQPVAVGLVWAIGFVWMTGYIAAGRNSADLLTQRWLQMLAGIVALGSVGALAFS